MAGSSKPLVVWALTVVLILAGGSALYLVRGALASGLDALLPAAEEAVPAVAEPVAAPPPPPPPPPPPRRLTYEEVEAKVAPLPEQVLTLIGDGLAELADLRDVDFSDERVRQRRWQPWGRIWRNRIGVLTKEMPPAGDCEAHADLEPACAMLTEVFVRLNAVPELAAVPDAEARLEEVRGVVDLFLNPPPEEEGEEGEEGDGA